MTVPSARPLWPFVVCFALAAVAQSRVGAEPRTFGFRGAVTRVVTEPGFRGTPLVNWPAVGSTFEGTYTFESTRPDTAGSESQGVYTTSPGGDVHVSAGDFRWSAPASFVSVIEPSGTAGEDVYEAGDWIPGVELISHPDLAQFFDRWNFHLVLRGGDDLLDGTGLPFVPPSLDRATVRTLTLYGDNGGNTTPIPLVVISASLDSLAVVPEPSALGVACGAVLPPLLLRRRH